jgi:hypothetical protein
MVRPIFAVLMIVLLCRHSNGADPAAAKGAAKAMLEKGWNKTKAAQTVVDDYKPKLADLGGDPRVRGAHWLVLMYQARYDLALDSVGAFLKQYPGSLDARRAEAWMHMVHQEYGQAMSSARQLAAAAAPASQAGQQAAPSPSGSAEAIEFLGFLAGFLEGSADKANDQERQKFEAQLVSRLSEPQRQQFQQAKESVLQRFQGLVGRAAAANQQQKEAADAAKVVTLGKLNDDSVKLSDEKSKAEDAAKKAADALQQKMADLERKDVPLQREWRKLTGEAERIKGLIQRQQDQVNQLEKQANDQNNPQRVKAQNDARQARNDLDFLNRDLRNYQIDIQRVESNHQMLVQQGLREQGQAWNAGQNALQKQKDVENAAKQIARDTRRAEEARVKAAAQALSLQSQARAFSTYAPFPFQELRARLLGQLK